MRQRIFHISLVVVMLAAGAGAFAITRTLKPQPSTALGCTRRWLGLSRGQCDKIRSEDPGFAEKSQSLSQTLQAQREALVGLIADPDSDDNAIRATAKEVLEAHHNLMRRVVQHLLVVRRHTDPRQCMRLTGLCSGVIGSGGGRAGPGAQHQGQGMGQGAQLQGQGMGPGPRGMGMGRGMRRRYGQLGPALGLNDAQRQAAAENDPSFETDAARLARQIHDAYALLAQNLEDTSAADSEVQHALQELIALRAQLEQRTVDYVLSIRKLLDTDQQQRLIGLSDRGHGRGWRNGGPHGFGPPTE